jgi:hypothetical protein
MPEIGTSGSMSGDGKRSVGRRPQAAAPILDSTWPCGNVSATVTEVAARKDKPKLGGARSRPDRRQEWLDAKDVHHAREIVGKNV